MSVPVSRIPAFLDSAGEALGRVSGVRVVAFGHLGDGNLHYNLSKPESDSNTRFIESTPAVNRIVHDLVASVGARFRLNTVSQLKRDEILRYRSADETAMMLAVKQLFDPRG